MLYSIVDRYVVQLKDGDLPTYTMGQALYGHVYITLKNKPLHQGDASQNGKVNWRGSSEGFPWI